MLMEPIATVDVSEQLGLLQGRVAKDGAGHKRISGSGLLGKARVGTTRGWLPVNALQPGDRILTHGAGLQPLVAIHQSPLWAGQAASPRALWPLCLPKGVVDNTSQLTVPADALMKVTPELAQRLCGDPEALVPARLLAGYEGTIARRPAPRTQVYALFFERPQLICVNGAALIHCGGLNEDDRVDPDTGPIILDDFYDALPESREFTD